MVAFKAHFDGKTIVPDEPVSLTPGQRLTVHVDQAPAADPSPTAWDVLESMIGSVEAPPDWSSETDHYLYGTPKRNSPPPQTTPEK